MKRIYQLIICLSILGLAVAGILYFKGEKQLNSAKSTNFCLEEISETVQSSGKNIRELYLERFKAKETELHQELSTIINIEQWNNDSAKLADEFKTYARSQQNAQSISSATKNLITQIGKEFKIQPNDFIIMHQEMGASPAAVEECIFYVNEKLLNSYPKKAQHFIIGHEFGHMVHHDGARLTTLEQQLDLTKLEHQNLFNKMSRFQEARADIFASTKDLKFAEGGLNFLTELYNRHGDQSGISHPKNSERIEAHKTIVALHNQAITVA